MLFISRWRCMSSDTFWLCLLNCANRETPSSHFERHCVTETPWNDLVDFLFWDPMKGFIITLCLDEQQRRIERKGVFDSFTLRVGCQPNHLTVTMHCNRYVLIRIHILLAQHSEDTQLNKKRNLKWALIRPVEKNSQSNKRTSKPSC